jgi:hypothetical protein
MLPALFFKKIALGAQEGQSKYGFLSSLTMAQCACESGYGKSAPGNNLFGIKANGTTGKTQILTTQEYISGKWITIKDVFRAYDSWADSVSDHALFLRQNSRYKNLIGCKDYKTACKLIRQDGYATAPDYADTLIGIIEQYKLYQYDTLPVIAHVDVANSVVIRGWALGVDRVDLYIDKNIGIDSCHEFTARPDVEKVYPNYKTTLCGFAFNVAGKIGKGKHTIKLAAIGKDKSVKWVIKNIKV